MMTTQIFAFILSMAMVTTLVALVFLLVNRRAVVRLLVGEHESAAETQHATTCRAPDRHMWLGLATFLLGAAATLGLSIGVLA